MIGAIGMVVFASAVLALNVSAMIAESRGTSPTLERIAIVSIVVMVVAFVTYLIF